MANRTAEVGWQHPETEEEFRVTCSVGEGQPEIRWGDSAQEALSGEVEIIRVVEDKPHGVERPDLIALVEADWDVIEERALIEVEEAEIAAWDAEQDRRCDEARDARMLGEHW
jgi:hypothetical protein